MAAFWACEVYEACAVGEGRNFEGHVVEAGGSQEGSQEGCHIGGLLESHIGVARM